MTGDRTLLVWEADATMTPERFAKVRSLYVVVAFKGEGPYFWDWMLWPESRFGETMPRPVANQQMVWRRPTLEDANARQIAFKTRGDWPKLVKQWGSTIRTYSTPAAGLTPTPVKPAAEILPGAVLHHLPAHGTPCLTDRYVVLDRYFGRTGELLAVALITRTGEVDPDYAAFPHCIGVETPYSHYLWTIEQTETP